MRTIPQRELRNQIARVLRDVEAGETVRITVSGRPVADLVPIQGPRRRFVPRDEVAQVIRQAPLDSGFARDLEAVISASIDEL